MSTGGAAINATIKQTVAASNVGNINTPNHPIYRRLLVEVIQEQNCSQRLSPERREAIVAVIRTKKKLRNIHREWTLLDFLLHPQEKAG